MWDKINTAMEEAESIKGISEISAVCYYSGLVITMNGTSTEIITKDSFYMDMDMSTVLKNDEGSLENTVNSVEAYYGGKMYSLYNDGTVDQKLCTEMTYEDFMKSQEDHTLDVTDYSDCTKTDFSKNENGNWILTMSGYTGSFIRKMLETTGFDRNMLGAAVDDVEITAVASENFLVDTIDMKFIFDDSDPTVSPEFTMKITYSEWGKAEMDPSLLKTDEYTLVDDIVVLSTIEDGITALQDAVSGNFDYNYKSTVNIFGTDDVTEESDVVSYGRKNGAYYFNIDSIYNGEPLTLSYSGGVYSVVIDGETNSEGCTDDEAKAIIDNLIGSAFYIKNTVSKVEKLSDGVYKLTVDKMASSEYSAALVESGITSGESSQEIIVTLDDENITKIETTINTKGVYVFDGQSVDITITEKTEITFKDATESAESV